MKKLLFVFLVILSFAGCSEDEGPVQPEDPGDIENEDPTNEPPPPPPQAVIDKAITMTEQMCLMI